MDARKLKALLRTLNAENVATYECTPDGGVKLSFRDGMPLVAAAEQPREEGDLELPPGVVDPRKLLAEVYAKRKRSAA